MSRPTQAAPAISLPRPRGLSAFHGLRLARDPLGFLERARAQCGDTFAIALPGDPLRVVTGNPSHLRTIFALPADAYRMANQAIPLNLGRGSLLFLDGNRHQQQHRLLMPPLHGDHLRSYAETIRRTTDSAIDGWPVAERFDLLSRMKWVTLTIICECVLGIATRERIEEVREWTHGWMKGPMSTLAFSLGMMLGAGRVRAFFDEQTLRSPVRRGLRPGRLRLPWHKIGDAKAALVGLLREDFLACRRDGPGDRTDVLALLAHTQYETGAPMDVDDAVDQLVTMLVGGYESVANALSWTLHHLMQSPDAWGELRAETTDLAGAEPTQRRPYAEACFREALRLHPIAPVVNRELTRPIRLGRYDIPEGSILWPSIYLAHTNAAVWSDPHRFDPARFLERHPRAYEWLPFGGGKRRCIGAAFAEMEMRIILSRVVERVDLRPASRSRPRAVLRGVTVSPHDGVRVVAEAVRPG